jgi:hypothetical protein
MAGLSRIRFARSDKQTALVDRHGKAQQSIPGPTMINPRCQAVVINTEVQLSQSSLTGRDAGCGFQRQVETTSRLRVILTDKIAAGTIALRTLHSDGHSKVACAELWSVRGRDFDP